MPRINVVDPKTATGETRALLDGVQQQLGAVPNFVRDGEIVEIVTLVALNVFTNMLGKSTLINIDFPKVALLASAEATA
jgi:hypothetical protein